MMGMMEILLIVTGIGAIVATIIMTAKKRLETSAAAVIIIAVMAIVILVNVAMSCGGIACLF